MTSWSLNRDELDLLAKIAEKSMLIRTDLLQLADRIDAEIHNDPQLSHAEWMTVIAALRYAQIARIAVLGQEVVEGTSDLQS